MFRDLLRDDKRIDGESSAFRTIGDCCFFVKLIGFLYRKQGMNEMKFLRREEQKQGNELMAKIRLQWEQMEEKFRQGEEVG